MQEKSTIKKSPETLHLLIEDAREAAENMARDEALFRLACGRNLAILRFYGWSRPSLSVGHFQDIKKHFDHEKIMKDSLPLVRRLTGGRGVMHSHELTYCFAMSSSLMDPFNKRSVFKFVNGLFLAAFAGIGVNALLKDRSDPSCSREHLSGDCFRSVSEYEVAQVDGMKLIGSAQMITSEGVLQQGSIPLNRSPEAGREIGDYLLRPPETDSPAPRTERGPFLDAIQSELKTAFKTVYLNRIVPDDIEIGKLVADRYANPEWTWRPVSAQ